MLTKEQRKHVSRKCILEYFFNSPEDEKLSLKVKYILVRIHPKGNRQRNPNRARIQNNKAIRASKRPFPTLTMKWVFLHEAAKKYEWMNLKPVGKEFME